MNTFPDIARSIIKMNPYGLINESLTARQMEAAITGAAHFYQGENFLYVADEVGLGKTYIALAIASILRYFSPNPELYTDLILVPKKNLQEKWAKEIGQFIQHNYQIHDNRVRSLTDSPMGKVVIYDNLQKKFEAQASYRIFRNTSFSIQTSEDPAQWAKKLHPLFSGKQYDIFGEAIDRHGEFSNEALKKLYAYLLNSCWPTIDLLIVDEAHNFKLGPDSSTRNTLVPRIFGAIGPHCQTWSYNNEDIKLFECFKDLKDMIVPKVKRVLCLSATPMNRHLIEIKQQIDCFLPKHLLNMPPESAPPQQSSTIIEQKLNTFLIRGVMHYAFGKQPISRNMYRHEHRKGNMAMAPDAKPMRVETDKENIILGLAQYQIIKNLKNTGRIAFETGLLSMFESFAKDENTFERETAHSCNTQDTNFIDADIIYNLSNSYEKQVGDDLPHPKQDKLVTHLMELMIKGEKALVFVRRIGSARELERKLGNAYVEHQLGLVSRLLQQKQPPCNVGNAQRILQAYTEDSSGGKIRKVLLALAERIIRNKNTLRKDTDASLTNKAKETLDEILHAEPTQLATLLEFIRSTPPDENNISDEHHQYFSQTCKTYADRERFSHIEVKFLNSTQECLLNYIHTHESTEDLKDGDGTDDSLNFLSRYFRGVKYRDKLYDQHWFMPNFLLLHKNFGILHIDYNQLERAPQSEHARLTQRVRFKEAQAAVIKAIKFGGTANASHASVDGAFTTNTFMTQLLTDECHHEMLLWIEERQKKEKLNDQELVKEIQLLCDIIGTVFIHGSGILPTYLAHPPRLEEINENLLALIQSNFPAVLEEVRKIIRNYRHITDKNFPEKTKITNLLTFQAPVFGVSGYHKRNISKIAAQFRMPGFPYVLVATDILREGEDLHTHCQVIYHYGVAWNPSDMEQRTGRIDRIGSLCLNNLEALQTARDSIPFENHLQVFFPYLSNTLEVNQVHKLLHDMDKFIETFYTGKFTDKEPIDPNVSLDGGYTHIPQQNKNFLSSRYDYTHFKSTYPKAFLCTPPPSPSQTQVDLLDMLRQFAANLASIRHIKGEEAKINAKQLKIEGILAVNGGRRAEYEVTIVPTKPFGTYNFNFGVNICRYVSNKDKRIYDEITSTIKKLYGCNYDVRSSSLWAIKECSSSCLESALKELLRIAQKMDELEKEYFGEDSIYAGEGEEY